MGFYWQKVSMDRYWTRTGIYCIEDYNYNIHGSIHREGGPAIERVGGTKEWYFDGKLHREGGPAVTTPNSSNGWYLNDTMLTLEEFVAQSPHFKNNGERVDFYLRWK